MEKRARVAPVPKALTEHGVPGSGGGETQLPVLRGKYHGQAYSYAMHLATAVVRLPFDRPRSVFSVSIVGVCVVCGSTPALSVCLLVSLPLACKASTNLLQRVLGADRFLSDRARGMVLPRMVSLPPLSPSICHEQQGRQLPPGMNNGGISEGGTGADSFVWHTLVCLLSF